MSRGDETWTVLRDGVVVLRALETSDAVAWKEGEDDEQRRWFEMPGPAPLANVVAAIERWRASWRDGGPVHHWGIWVDGRLAGGVELRLREDGRANVSYIVFPSARHRGIATRATRLAAEWALASLGASAVIAVIDPGNEASLGVARSVGFRADGWAERWEYGETGPMVRYVLEAESRAP